MSFLVYKNFLAWWISELSAELKKRAEAKRAWNKKNPEKRKITDQRNYFRHREARLFKMQEWRKKNLEKKRAWGKKNPEKVRAMNRRAYLANTEKIKKQASDWYKKNRARRNTTIRNWRKNKRASDSNFKIKEQIRSRINGALPRKTVKSARTLELIGCSIPALREHLKKQFQPGMSWENYGDWHIDHVRPCASFDLRDLEQQKLCFHYSNLQPLWAKDNLSKGAKYVNPG